MILDSPSNTVTFEILGPPATRGLANVTTNHDCLVAVDIVTELLDAATGPNAALLNTAIWDDPVGGPPGGSTPTGTGSVFVAETPSVTVEINAAQLPAIAFTGYDLQMAFLGASTGLGSVAVGLLLV